MNEAETRAELIDPKPKEDGWDGRANSELKVHREYHITAGKIKATGGWNKPVIADYLLTFKGRKMAVVEAKSDECEVGECIGQAKDYAEKLKVEDCYGANGPYFIQGGLTVRQFYFTNVLKTSVYRNFNKVCNSFIQHIRGE